jgi:phospholipid transport system substrate-binding protein
MILNSFSIGRPVGRRGLLGFAVAAVAAAGSRSSADAQTANNAGSIAPIQRLNAALLGTMRSGSSLSFAQRFAVLAPVIEQTFDLDAILAASVGLRWPELPNDQKAQVGAAFRRYTIASYASNFDSYNGQTFQFSPDVRAVGNGEVIVSTKLVARDGSATPLDYVMRDGPSGWKVVDVMAGGEISRVAVQRSDFRTLLAGGGAPALTVALQNKVANLSGGMRS